MWSFISWTNLEDLLLDMSAILVVTVVVTIWVVATNRRAERMYGSRQPEPGPLPPLPLPQPEPPSPVPGPPHPEPLPPEPPLPGGPT